jgi:histone-lysine N-methyltransferase SETMAR
LDQVLLHQDNGPSHNAASTRLEISLLDFQILEHAPYSPDMAPMDFRVFPTVKSALKGRKFDSFQELTYATKKWWLISTRSVTGRCTTSGYIDTIGVLNKAATMLRKTDIRRHSFINN